MNDNLTMVLDEVEIQDLTAIRHKLHQIAEVSEMEMHTAAYIRSELEKLEPDELITELGGYGLLAVYNGKEAGKTILFRAELDALPILELNIFEHKSKNDGVSHKCGHDGHMTSLLGMAKVLDRNRPEKGRVLLLFQPAEENGMGAQGVIKDSRFDAFAPDFVFAYHNLPAYPLNKIVYRRNSFTAAVKSVIFEFHGKTAHAAEPENGVNPALAISEIVQKIQEFSNNDPARDDFKLITTVHMELGEKAYGISAGYGELHLTIRSWNQKSMGELDGDICRTVDAVSEKYGTETTKKYLQEFASNENNDVAIDYLETALNNGGFDNHKCDYPFKWGEDFGLFTQKFPGAMFGIGSGINCPALHNPDYDFPDAITPQAVSLFYEIMNTVLK